MSTSTICLPIRRNSKEFLSQVGRATSKQTLFLSRSRRLSRQNNRCVVCPDGCTEFGPVLSSGTVNYTYTDFSTVATRLDARGVTTTYAYDGLNRLKTMSYSGTPPAAPTVNLNYDAGGAAAFALGRLTSMTDGVGSEAYTYDALGRITQLSKVISGVTYPIQYGYNLASELTSLTYPSGRVVAQTYDAIGRLSQIQSGGTNFLTINSSDYNAAFEPLKATYGNGVQATFSYNARLQLQTLA